MIEKTALGQSGVNRGLKRRFGGVGVSHDKRRRHSKTAGPTPPPEGHPTPNNRESDKPPYRLSETKRSLCYHLASSG